MSGGGAKGDRGPAAITAHAVYDNGQIADVALYAQIWSGTADGSRSSTSSRWGAIRCGRR
jgi:hypothetical protein